jgi:hypothetical protein
MTNWEPSWKYPTFLAINDWALRATAQETFTELKDGTASPLQYVTASLPLNTAVGLVFDTVAAITREPAPPLYFTQGGLILDAVELAGLVTLPFAALAKAIGQLTAAKPEQQTPAA